MELHNLQKSPGLKDKPFRLGRWDSARKGNYSGKGMKWQKSRAGWGVPVWFEGGQTPLHMRIPKLRGFKRYYKLRKDARPVALADLQADDRIADGSTITVSLLAEYGYCKNASSIVKILGSGPLSKKLTFEWIERFSATARKAIEDAWSEIK